ncbi:hypothetical protein Moror_5667 [Moniliophthora roreri MCA 2997]|nr:hypothetical protein Moror_5667 [Moniliophthora roreri MCA 2997]
MKADAGDTEEIQCKRKDDKWYCTPGDDKTKGLSIFPGDAVDFWFPKPPKDGIETKGSHAKFDSFVFAVETSEFDFGPVFMTNIKIKTDGGNMDWCNNVKYSGDAKHKTGEVKVKDNDCEVQYVSLG